MLRIMNIKNNFVISKSRWMILIALIGALMFSGCFFDGGWDGDHGGDRGGDHGGDHGGGDHGGGGDHH
jgi:hypothetical protein